MTGDSIKKIIVEADDYEDESGNTVIKSRSRVLIFGIGNENYGVDIKQAKEVIPITGITKVPTTPDFIVGIINLRGEIVSVIDVRSFFGLENISRTKEARIVITDAAWSTIGILVDKVKSIVDIDYSTIQPPIATISSRVADCTKGVVQIDKDVVILIDLEKVLKIDDIEHLRKGEGV